MQDSDGEDRLERLKSILIGGFRMELYLDFLCRHNKTDLNILLSIKVCFLAPPFLSFTCLSIEIALHLFFFFLSNSL